jgi:hypothetical protein
MWKTRRLYNKINFMPTIKNLWDGTSSSIDYSTKTLFQPSAVLAWDIVCSRPEDIKPGTTTAAEAAAAVSPATTT